MYLYKFINKFIKEAFHSTISLQYIEKKRRKKLSITFFKYYDNNTGLDRWWVILGKYLSE